MQNIGVVVDQFCQYEHRWSPENAAYVFTCSCYGGGDTVADSHSILSMWEVVFFWSFIELRGVNNVRQTEIYAAEPQVLDHLKLSVLLKSPKI